MPSRVEFEGMNGPLCSKVQTENAGESWWRNGISVVKGKVCIRARRPIRLALNSGFCSMKRLGILLLPLDGMLVQGLEGVLRDPGFGRNRARDSGIQKKPSRDSWILYWLWRGIFFFCSPWFVISNDIIPWIPWSQNNVKNLTCWEKPMANQILAVLKH